LALSRIIFEMEKAGGDDALYGIYRDFRGFMGNDSLDRHLWR
jgi:hypothetical protein